jgi:hypothetical protein
VGFIPAAIGACVLLLGSQFAAAQQDQTMTVFSSFFHWLAAVSPSLLSKTSTMADKFNVF